MQTRRSILAVAAALAAACGQSSTAPLSLSVRAGSSASAPSRALTAGTGIEVQRIRVAVGRIRLETGERVAEEHQHGDDDQVGSTAHHEGEIEVSAGPFLVDLGSAALAGGVQHVFDAAVPAGTYEELKLEVKPMPIDGTNASVIVDGTIDGAPFTFASSVAAMQKHEGSFVVTADSNNITLQIDPSGWFTDAAGARLDPREPAARGAIEANLVRSMHAFQDDDRSGHENHHGDDSDGGHDDHGGGDGGSDDHGGGDGGSDDHGGGDGGSDGHGGGDGGHH